MTEAARQVLEDCRVALYNIRTQEPMGADWRIDWAALVALLRSVGYVLKNVDGTNDSDLNAVIKTHFRQWKQRTLGHYIFTVFIDRERHNILKEYSFTAGQGVKIHVPAPDETGYTEILYKMTSGPFQGQNPLDVAEQAIEWWETQLDTIDAETIRRKDQGPY